MLEKEKAIAARAIEIAEELRKALPLNTDFGEGWQRRYLDRQNERLEKALEMARAEFASPPPVSSKSGGSGDADKGAGRNSAPREFWDLLHEWADSSDEERRDWIEHRFCELFALATSPAAAPVPGDTKRLDWLEAMYSGTAFDGKAWQEFCGQVAQHGYRAAIDAQLVADRTAGETT